MTALEQYRERPAEVATIPQAAAGLVEWAHAAQAAHTLAQSLVQTAFVPQTYRGKPAEATAAILAGAELGLNPLASLRAFDNIQGTAAPKAITLRAVAQAHGHDVEVAEESDVKAVVEYRRRGSDTWRRVEWTIEQARGLGLTSKDNWKKQPKAMLVARATAEAARRVASDAILGIPYSAEELEDSQPEPTTPVQRASRRVQRQARPTPPEPEFEDTPPVSSRTEPEAPETPAEPDPAPDPITPKQLTALNAALSSDLGLTEREDKLAYLSGELGREIGSSKDVTKAEAMRLLDNMAAEREDPPAEPPLDGDWPTVAQPGGAA